MPWYRLATSSRRQRTGSRAAARRSRPGMTRLSSFRAARKLESLVIPGRDRLAAALDPVLCRLDEVASRYHGIDQLQPLGLGEVERLALQEHLHGILRRHDARHALGAAGAGEKPDLDFGQAEPGLGIVGGDAVMA